MQGRILYSHSIATLCRRYGPLTWTLTWTQRGPWAQGDQRENPGRQIECCAAEECATSAISSLVYQIHSLSAICGSQFHKCQTGSDSDGGHGQGSFGTSQVQAQKVPNPKPSGLPPVPVMHSPARAVTVKDQQDWKIPPCISNGKNPKGYRIPLAKRLAADGRGLEEVQINDDFSKLSEALYVAEQKGRGCGGPVQNSARVRGEGREKKENELRVLTQRARVERAGVVGAPPAVGEDRERLQERGTGTPVRGWPWEWQILVSVVGNSLTTSVYSTRRRAWNQGSPRTTPTMCMIRDCSPHNPEIGSKTTNLIQVVL